MGQNNCDDDKTPCVDADDLTKKSVREFFYHIGVNVDDPASLESFREDLRFSRRLRKAANHGSLAMVGAISVGVVVVLWSGLVDKVLGGR
jgi:hypothetical protein